MKKIFILTAIFALVLCACDGGKRAQCTLLGGGDRAGAPYVVIRADADGGSLFDGMQALKAESLLDYTVSEGQFGVYIESVNGYSDGSGYFGIYISFSEADGVEYSTREFGSFEYEGKVFGSALYGASGLPLFEGEIYVIAFTPL